MSKKYLLIELSYEAPNNTSADAVLHNVYIDINHPENLAMFSESCKNRHEINENLPICQLITSWVRLLGIFTILDNSDQDKETPVLIQLADGGTLSIDGWEILDQETKDRRLALMDIEPDEEQDVDDPILFAHEHSDSITLTKVEKPVAESVYVAMRNSYSNNFDLVLECILNPEKHYSLYQGSYDGTHVQVILNDLALLPSCKTHKSEIGDYVTCNVLELFKGSIDAYGAESEFIDSFVQLDITPYLDSTLKMDYIELQFSYQSNDLIAFFGNDPCS